MESVRQVSVQYRAQQRDVHYVYEGLMLSCRGSERQRRSPLQLALIFQKTMLEKLEAFSSEKNAPELAFNAAVDEYNSFGSVATNRRWQIQGEERAAARNLTLSVSEPVKEMMAKHYDKYKGTESGAPSPYCSTLLADIRPRNSSARGAACERRSTCGGKGRLERSAT